MNVSIATGDTRKCPAARKIAQVLPETMAVVRGLPGRNVLDTRNCAPSRPRHNDTNEA